MTIHIAAIAQLFADQLHVCDQMPGGVVVERGMRPAAATAALVKENDVIATRVEKAALGGGGATTGTAMDKDHGNAIAFAALFHIDFMPVAGRDMTGVPCLDGRV